MALMCVIAYRHMVLCEDGVCNGARDKTADHLNSQFVAGFVHPQ